jgi:hypothetical protein
MDADGAEREHRAWLWMIQFTATDGERAREYAWRAAGGEEVLEVAAAGRYGFAAVGTHHQVIALRDAVIPAGESFAITRAIMAELYPDGQVLSYEGGDPGAFSEQARARLGLDPAGDDRWESAQQFRCPARVLDIVLADYGEWRLRGFASAPPES